MVLWIIAALCGSFVKGLCGVGDAPVFSAILAFANDNRDINPINGLFSLPVNLYITWKERKGLNRHIWLPLSAVIVAGSIIGIVLLKNIDTKTLKTVFGFFIIFIGIVMLANELSPKKLKPSKVSLAIIGLLAGLSCGLFAIGILLVVYVSQTTENMSQFKANICAVFAVENTVRLILLAFLGILTPAIFLRALALSPCIAIGLFLGIKSGGKLDERKARLLVMASLVTSGIAIVATNL